MTKHWMVLFGILFCTTVGFSRHRDTPIVTAPEAVEKNRNVILVTFDGVRWQEVFGRRRVAPVFKRLWESYVHEGVIFGNSPSFMTASNPTNFSLPGYQSIMAGVAQPCPDNECGRIGVETLHERVLRELKLDAAQVATIASWEKIPDAVEHIEGSTFVNAAFQPLDDGTADPVFAAINEAQAEDIPRWKGARYDRYTWAHSMHYLTKYRPRFMFISLDDSDELGHLVDWKGYETSLRQYDVWISELIETLKSMGDYGANTTLIVTTDHGRGNGAAWSQHGWFIPVSGNVWLYGRPAPAALNSKKASAFGRRYTHADIRPTIEAALGLEPSRCEKCGQVISEIVP